MALPTNVGYGTVVGQFLLAYSDSDDSGLQPDGLPAKGNIYFRPSPAKLLDAGASPNPVTILPAVVETTLDSEGYLCGYTGDRGVRLVATDDADLKPTDWTWTADFRLTDQDDTPIAVASFSFELPVDDTVDLATAGPVPAADGVFYLTGPAGPAGPAGPTGATGPTGPANTLSIGTVTGGGSASATITGTAPSQTLNLVLPTGATGATGAGYDGITSTSSVAIGVGSKSFVLNKLGALAIGTRVRISNTTTPSSYMEGIITGIATLTATVNVDNTSGSGTLASWRVAVAGDKGANGSLGALSATAPVTYKSGTSTIGFDWNTTIDGGTA